MFNLSGKMRYYRRRQWHWPCGCFAFGKQGAAVHVVDISEENANHAAAEIIENGGGLSLIPAM